MMIKNRKQNIKVINLEISYIKRNPEKTVYDFKELFYWKNFLKDKKNKLSIFKKTQVCRFLFYRNNELIRLWSIEIIKRYKKALEFEIINWIEWEKAPTQTGSRFKNKLIKKQWII